MSLLARRNASKRLSYHRRLGIEKLEDRRLLAAGDLDTSFDTDGKVLTNRFRPTPVGLARRPEETTASNSVAPRTSEKSRGAVPGPKAKPRWPGNSAEAIRANVGSIKRAKPP